MKQRFAAVLGSEAALELPTKPLDLADGEKLYQESCATCHGPRGMGDGPAGAALNPKPPAIGSAEEMGDVAPAMIYRKMSVGVTGTAMPAFASTAHAEQRWNVVVYLGVAAARAAAGRRGRRTVLAGLRRLSRRDGLGRRRGRRAR